MYRDQSANPSIILTAFNSVVALLDAETGEARWQASIAGAPSMPIRLHVRDRDVVALSSTELAVISLDDGQVLRRVRVTTNRGATLLVRGERAFVSTDGVLVCVDLASGKELWRNDLPGTGFGPAALAVPGFAVQGDAAG